MNDPAMRVENLGKRYRIGSVNERNKTFREAVTDKITAPWRSMKNVFRKQADTGEERSDHIWALKDVSFEVKHGEVVGIIGRNGAGKSTLLKILSRITEPTEGRVVMRGRVGSLLEVGTGFHSELTGEENIYLSGTILGMRSNEVSRKFDEIVAFAEVEKFIYTPVKHYSSGMYMRLAFAVAAHLEPEILVVDEVLSVGDAQFQKKCLGKMELVGREGRTVLFVSHNMSAIISLCQRGMLLENGRLEAMGDMHKVVTRYLSSGTALNGNFTRQGNSGGKKLEIKQASIEKNGKICTLYYNSESMVVRITYAVLTRLTGAQIAIELLTESQECLFSTTNLDGDYEKRELDPGSYVAECPIDLQMFRQGTYYIRVTSSIPNREMLDTVDDLLVFEVYDDSSPLLKLGQNRHGIILPLIRWRHTLNLPLT
ncbi:MAG: ABC transporter ATP-binding protein [Deltaproteobacteria bacterium]|nr:ABC transporter ATP-binding protein [Deltaproteobacteria bacterium]